MRVIILPAAALVMAILALPADAAPISWSAAQNISGDADVDTTGTLLSAVNLTDGLGPNIGPGTTMINGVPFTGLPAASAPKFGFGNFSFSSISGGGFIFPNVGAPFSSLSSAYRTLLETAGFGIPLTLTLTGLTIGRQYELEWWSSDVLTAVVRRPRPQQTA